MAAVEKRINTKAGGRCHENGNQASDAQPELVLARYFDRHRTAGGLHGPSRRLTLEELVCAGSSCSCMTLRPDSVSRFSRMQVGAHVGSMLVAEFAVFL